METLRVSSYMIPVKLEKENGKYMLIHGYTGAIDVITENLLQQIKQTNAHNNLSEKTLQTLINRGYLTYKTEEEEYAYVARIAQALHKKARIISKSFTLVITYNCNFRCPYCFEERESKDNIQQFSFTREMVDKVFHAMDIIEPNRVLRNNIICLYGGEPLLKENKEIVSYIVKEGQKKGYIFSAITNGYDLEYFLDLLAEDAICKIQVTLDGMKDTHNQRRIHFKEKNTFDKIISNIHLALEKNIIVQIRVNTDQYNINEFISLKNLFEQLGFTQYKKFGFYSTLIQNNDAITIEEKKKLDFLPIKDFFHNHDNMKTISHCHDYGIFQKVQNAITENKPIQFRPVFCPSQSGGYVFDPFGMIYPCLEVIGKKAAQLGRYLHDTIEWNDNVIQKWRNYDISSSSKCQHCENALLCGGGCVAHAFNQKSNHCTYFKQAFNVAVNRAFERLDI